MAAITVEEFVQGCRWYAESLRLLKPGDPVLPVLLRRLDHDPPEQFVKNFNAACIEGTIDQADPFARTLCETARELVRDMTDGREPNAGA